MGTQPPGARSKDAPSNAVLLNETIADYTGVPMEIPRAIAVFERYAGPEYKHQEMGQPNVSTERRELVVRWISTVGNYDYILTGSSMKTALLASMPVLQASMR